MYNRKEENNKYKTINCIICNKDLYLESALRRYSLKNYGVILCREHQTWIEDAKQESSFFALRLFFALKIRNIPAILEKFDGFKHIDIAIPQAKINIEVDGVHHNFDSKQALSDLKRTCYSLLKGYTTIRIPNSLVYKNETLEETAEYLTELINFLIKKSNDPRRIK